MAHILIVDDQEAIREILIEELKERYSVDGIGDATALFSYLSRIKPDVVVLDLYLDGFEGWEILSKIKKIYPNIYVIIFTAYDSFMEDPRISIADGYLIKSFGNLELLKKKISDLLNDKVNFNSNNDDRKYIINEAR